MVSISTMAKSISDLDRDAEIRVKVLLAQVKAEGNCWVSFRWPIMLVGYKTGMFSVYEAGRCIYFSVPLTFFDFPDV